MSGTPVRPVRVLLALALCAPVLGMIAAPAAADGRKRPPAHVAPPVPPLRTSPPSVKPPEPLPPPVVPFTPVSREITLPPDFGSGGVGFDINGGYGGGRTIVIASGNSRAQASASAAAFAFASASAFSRSRGGHGGGGCGGCR